MLDDEEIKDLFFPAYSFHNDTSGKEHLTIEFARAKGYADQLSDVVTRGMRSRESEGAAVYPVKFGYLKRREHLKPELCSLFPVPDQDRFPIMERAFELALSGHGTRVIVEHLKEEFSDCPNFRPTISTMDYRLRDSFYCGKWVIKPGSKKERIIDMRKITLTDGTRFSPVVSEEEFQLVQETRRKNKSAIQLTRKRANECANYIANSGY